MKNKLVLSSLIISLGVLPLVSGAHENGTEHEHTSTSVQVNTSIKVHASSGNASTSSEARIKAKADFEARKKELEQKREELKEEMEERKEAIKAEFETRKASIKSEVEERRENALEKIKERLGKFTENIKERFNAAIERLEKLAERIDARITKMEAENIDVKTAKELLLVAKLKIDTAKVSVSGIHLDSEVISSSTATSSVAFKADFDRLKTQVEKAKGDIKAAHAALIEVVKNLKPGRNKTATSTATTTPN